MMSPSHLDVVVIGAGFSGLLLLHLLRKRGFHVKVVERLDGVGGTWYANSYPGCRVDVESYSYSYSFDDELQQEWRWKENLAARPELLAYLNHVVERFDLGCDIELSSNVEALSFNEDRQLWHVTINGEERYTCNFVVAAVGCLSEPLKPTFAGMDSFRGKVLHTTEWPKDNSLDAAGKRVGIIGTGSTGMQLLPVVAETAERVVVFQRTANYCTKAGIRTLTDEEDRAMKGQYKEIRADNLTSHFAYSSPVPTRPSVFADTPEEREKVFEAAWDRGAFSLLLSYGDLLLTPEANRLAADFIRRKIRSTVKDQRVADKLCPSENLLWATKRPSVADGYYEAFNRDNVHLVSLKEEPFKQVVESGVETESGVYDLDILVLATGFKAMTGALNNIRIVGRQGRMLHEDWRENPSTYLGLTIAGYPNLFTVAGPYSPSVLTSMVTSCEQSVFWIVDCLSHLRDVGIKLIEPKSDEEQAWVQHSLECSNATVYKHSKSWYTGYNVDSKNKNFMVYFGGFHNYKATCDKVAKEGYNQFILTPT